MPSSGNFGFVIDSSFQPFTLQDYLAPGLIYKEAFEKAEEAYNELSQKADVFRDLSSSLPEDSKARKIYEGYAGNLRAQAEDLAQNGLTLGNRGALSSLKRRYSGEIGRLERANEALKKAQETREALMASGKDMIYAVDNFNIDDFLDGKRPDMFAVNSDELYARGAAAGKAASSRVFSVNGEEQTLGGYYLDYVQKKGYSKEQINAFLKDPNAIPELRDIADNIIKERIGTRLTGANLERARQSIINGIVDGAIYEELHSPQKNLGKLSAYESAQIGLEQQKINLQRAQLAMAARGGGGGGRGRGQGGGGGGNTHMPILKSPIRLEWKVDPTKNNGNGQIISKNPIQRDPKNSSRSPGVPISYEDLPDGARQAISNAYFIDPRYHTFLYHYKKGSDRYTVDIQPLGVSVIDDYGYDYGNSDAAAMMYADSYSEDYGDTPAIQTDQTNNTSNWNWASSPYAYNPSSAEPWKFNPGGYHTWPNKQQK